MLRIRTATIIFILIACTDQTIAQADIDTTAEKMLLWQRSNGGWPKESYTSYFNESKVKSSLKLPAPPRMTIDYKKEMPPEHAALAIETKDFTDATIDNKHTVMEIRHLLQSYKTTLNAKYLVAAENGLSYLLKAQYSNGGWPQFYPDLRGYRHNITFNDNAMVNVMNLMMDVSKGLKNTESVDQRFIPLAKTSFETGIEAILKTQMIKDGKKTVWCAQHDEVTFKPAKARAYELPSFSGDESAEIVRVLMRVESPGKDVKEAIRAAVKWFEEMKIVGFKTERIDDPKQPSGKDVILVADATSVIWARFYDLETNKPFFCDRDGVKKSTLTEIGNERRVGYLWYGVWPAKVIGKEFETWKQKHAI